MKFFQLIGVTLYWLAWPVYKVYFRFGDRTRIVVIQNGEILVTQQWIGTGKWSLPGGGLHYHEQPAQGALRELREETGLQVTPQQLDYLGIHDYRQHGQHFRFHVYVCELSSRPALRRQWYEILRLAWLPPAAITLQSATSDAVQSVQLVAARTRLLQ